ncbi:MAG: hypothetical protein QOD99_2313 [Chthoniobacter sp.]|jgi:hypothetical protein|nr:hypothetical protein [Chthoniobacter sp.]
MTERARYLKSFAVELGVYGALVTVYFFLVLHFLARWIEHLYRTNTRGYAVAAILLIVGQGIVLEMLTSALLRFIRARKE